MTEKADAGVVGNIGGNLYDKYHSRNPLARRLMAGFLAAFDTLTAREEVRSVYEIGCGEGELSRRLLRRGLRVRGSDLDSDIVDQANRAAAAQGFGQPFTVRSVYDLDVAEAKADMVICCEVLEHLADPERAIQRLSRFADRYIVLSVPREPIWRILNLARAKYVSALGNTPGHLQHWSSAGFVRLVSRYCEVIAVRRPLPWTVVLCRPN
jgi:2-polyprenyl-3-methyl-5-hydroxy-6-metoxy-1,4-benzoquinol methylase